MAAGASLRPTRRRGGGAGFVPPGGRASRGVPPALCRSGAASGGSWVRIAAPARLSSDAAGDEAPGGGVGGPRLGKPSPCLFINGRAIDRALAGGAARPPAQGSAFMAPLNASAQRAFPGRPES